MRKRLKSFMAGLAVCFFAFAMTSSCYCAPSYSASEPSAQPSASHCTHHGSDSKASTEKNQDCAPRYQTDQFENSHLGNKDFFDSNTFVFSLHGNAINLESDLNYSPELSFSSQLSASPPQFFLLHHSFLI